jgi:hypothetical protein
MELRLQIFIALVIVVTFLMIANMVRKKLIDLRYALKWLLLCVVVLVLDIFPEILNWFAVALGVSLPSNMVFMVAIFLLVVTVYSLTASVSRLSTKTKRLTQELALLRDEVEKMKED